MDEITPQQEYPNLNNLNEEGLRALNHLRSIYDPEKAEIGMNVILMVDEKIQQDVQGFYPTDPRLERWARVRYSIGREMIWVTIRNAEIYGLHFLSEYFEAQDGPQIASRICFDPASRDENCLKFETALERLFRARDFLRGGKSVGPLTKQMISTGAYPPTKYLAFDNLGMQLTILADIYRQEEFKEIIDYLVSRFNHRRRPYWRKVFRHIADGGDGIARQIHTGPKLSVEDEDNTIKVVGNGKLTIQEAAKRLFINERGLRRRKQKLRKAGKLPDM